MICVRHSVEFNVKTGPLPFSNCSTKSPEKGNHIRPQDVGTRWSLEDSLKRPLVLPSQDPLRFFFVPYNIRFLLGSESTPKRNPLMMEGVNFMFKRFRPSADHNPGQ